MMPQCKPTLRIADDEEVIANTLATILSQSGFDAHAVYRGEKVLEMVQVLKPDILIYDVVMTGITGVETAIRVRAILPSCKVLLFSGQAPCANLLEEARVEGYGVIVAVMERRQMRASCHAKLETHLRVTHMAWLFYHRTQTTSK
jgi:DNA-binding NtrC family response regulator